MQTIKLHTNSNKKIVFIFSVTASTFFNVLLFQSIGSNLILKLVWALVGVGVVFFQTVKLREYYNTTKLNRYVHLSFYILCTLGSVTGTIGAGYSQIEKLKPTLEKKEIVSMNNAIDSVLNNSKELNQWAVINLIKKKEILNNQEENIRNSDSAITSSLVGISKILRVSEEMTSFIFLIFASLIIEAMVFGSATYSGELFKNKKHKKLTRNEKFDKAGQLKLRKVN